MSNLKLNLEWSINPLGEPEVIVTDEHGVLDLGKLAIDQTQIVGCLDEDIEEFHEEGDFEVINDWFAMATYFQQMANHITSRLKEEIVAH